MSNNKRPGSTQQEITIKKRRVHISNENTNHINEFPVQKSDEQENEESKDDQENEESKDDQENEESKDDQENEESKDDQENEESEDDQENEESEDDQENEESEDENFIDKELENLKKSDPVAYKVLEEVKAEIIRTEPQVKQLLLTPLRLEDRAKLCQYYEIYKMQCPSTNEWLEARNKYNEMFKEYKAAYEQHIKYSDNEITCMKAEENKFTGFDPQLSLKYKILNLDTSHNNKEVIYRKYEKLTSLDSSDDEYCKLKQWLNWATEIPHDRVKDVKVDNITDFIRLAKAKLDIELYGMEKVKEQILLFLSAKLHNPKMVHTNMGLIGPPGVGKTAIARLIADIMDWGFAQISFGGADKASFLKGHDYTYVGAQPGEIVKCLKRIGHKNGVIFLDELEKISENPDISAALLHLIDHTQNKDFRDLYLSEIIIDLSQIWYIGSMNNLPKDDALTDRWWLIEVNGYDNNDKVQIIEKYLLPRALENCGMLEKSVFFKDDDATRYLIKKICKPHDMGVRTMKKAVKDLVNKISFLITHQDFQGKLPFKTSFQLKYPLVIPVELDIVLLKQLLETKEFDTMMNMMYI